MVLFISTICSWRGGRASHDITVSVRRVPHLPLLQLLLQLADLSLCHRIIDAPSSLALIASTLGKAVDRQLLEKFAQLRQLHLCRKSRREMQAHINLRTRQPGASGNVVHDTSRWWRARGCLRVLANLVDALNRTIPDLV
jgi:hypothetical protein